MLPQIFLSAAEKIRFDLSDSIEYLETPPEYHLGNIMQHQRDFRPLEKSQFRNMKKLIRKDGDYIWLRIRFTVPDELKNQNLGLFIAQLNASDLFFINNTALRMYGSFPPNQLPAGFVAQYFMIPQTLLTDGVNTAIIQIAPATKLSISDYIFLGTQEDVYNLAESKSFFNSKILVVFAGTLFIIFFIFFILGLKIFKYKEAFQFVAFSMLMFYSIHFLVPFFITEISWIKPRFISYFSIVKFFFGMGTFTTIYFVNSFIAHYVDLRENRKVIIIRCVLWIIPVLGIIFIRNFSLLMKLAPAFAILTLSQFFFGIPKIIRAFFIKEKRKSALTLTTGFSPVLLGLITDGIIKGLLKIYHLPYFTVYGWQATAFVFLFFLIIRLGKLYTGNIELRKQLTSFNSHLEDVVAMRTKEITEANFILSRGLETVSHVQKNFLPPKNKIFRGWEIAINYRALDNEVSGDLYDYYYNKTMLSGLGVFDVSGHGIPAGLMTILAKGIISQHFLAGIAISESTSDILKEINKSYIKEKVNVENYITGLLFRFSEFNGSDVCSLEVANAGHPYPIIYTKHNDSVSELKYEDSDKQYGILGVEDLDVSFPPVSCRLAQDDILVCYTDGITEACNKNGDDFTKERLMELIKENAALSADEIKENVMSAFYDFIGDNPITDDLTLIILKRTNSHDYIEEI